MKPKITERWTTGLVALCLAAAVARADPPLEEAKPAAAPAADADTARRAEERYQEMLGRMQAAVEEIAGLYGNPAFLQVFTNDPPRAAELRERLGTLRSRGDAEKAAAQLEKRRDELMADIALKEREAKRLSERLARQRVALESLAAAVDLARKAVEDTAP